MKQRAEINKNVTLHGLRHSIATHLLQSGMDIEEIAKFLGHSSLASTQIYTHIINQHERNLKIICSKKDTGKALLMLT